MWSLVASMNYYRQRFGLAVLDNKLYAAGGWNDSITLQSVEVYNPRLDGWAECPGMNDKRRSFGVRVFFSVRINYNIFINGK